MGQLEKAGPSPLLRPGEGPLLIAEQLALQQVLRESRHVDGNKGAVRPEGRLMDGMGKELLPGARLADEQDGALASGHAAQGLLGFDNGLRPAHHVGKTVFRVVALVEKLAAQLALPGLHVVEPLKQGEGPDAGVLPDHRHHLHAEVHPAHLHRLGGQGPAALHALDEGDVGKHLLAPPSLDQRGADQGHFLGVAAAREDLPLLVDAHHAVLQALH